MMNTTNPRFNHRRLALVAATAALLTALPLTSQAGVDVSIRIGPPPLRVEAVPAPRVGFVWAPGHWVWRTNRHVWVAGSGVKARPGYRYVAPTWVQGPGGWVMNRGNWVRDRDRDGIPNRYDHDRDNDGVRNRFDRDRDNDGIRNGPDRHPRNPNRP